MNRLMFFSGFGIGSFATLALFVMFLFAVSNPQIKRQGMDKVMHGLSIMLGAFVCAWITAISKRIIDQCAPGESMFVFALPFGIIGGALTYIAIEEFRR